MANRETPAEATEILFLKFNPAGLALEMLEPPVPEKAVPVLAEPLSDCMVTQVPARLLAQNPLVSLGFFDRIVASSTDFGKLRGMVRGTGKHQDLLEDSDFNP